MNNPEQAEVLLVEDNPADVELTLRAFERHKLANKVYVAKDGAEALDFVFCKGVHSNRSFKVPPKVVILDLKLSLVDGKEVLKAIRGDKRTKALPVVILTSSQEESDVIASYDLGVNSYVVKPVDFEKFSDAIKDIGYYWLFVNKPPIF